MNDDFNTPKAIAVLFERISDLNKAKIAQQANAKGLAFELVELGSLLGILNHSPDVFLQGVNGEGSDITEYVEAQIEKRNEARKAKNFSLADQIRNDLLEEGIELKDDRDGMLWYKNS